MSALAKRLVERRANVFEQMKAIGDDAAAENRNLDAEEQRSWDEMNAELDGLDQRIKTITSAEEREKTAAEAIERVHGRPQDLEQRGRSELMLQASNELRDWILGKNPAKTFDMRGSVQGLNKGFIEARTLSKLTSGAGGYAIPSGFYPELVQNLIVNSAILQAGARVLNTSDGRALPVTVTTSHSTGALVAETAQIATSEPVFSQYNLGAFKYGAMAYASSELVEDAGFDIEGFIAEDMGRGVGNALGADLVNGNGSSKPRGLLLDTTLGVTTGTGVVGVPTADNLIDLYFSVTAPYRNQPSAAWIMNDATVAVVRKLKDTTGQYIWQPGLQAGVPDTLLGRPVYTDPNMPTTGLNAKSVAFGDLSKYWVRIDGGVRFERSTEFKFDTDQISFRCLVRADGVLVDRTGAVKHLVGAAS